MGVMDSLFFRMEVGNLDRENIKLQIGCEMTSFSNRKGGYRYDMFFEGTKDT